MADNTTTKDGGGTTIPVATDKVTYSGDADQNLALMHPVMVTGAEGSKVVSEVFVAEDAVHSSGDFGMMALGVRKDTATALAGADGDYQPAIFDASGRQHVNVGNTVTVDTELPAATALADTRSNPTEPSVGADNSLYSSTATQWNRQRAIEHGFNTAGAGIAAAGMMVEFDDTSPTSVTENQFAPLRGSSRREAYTQIRDAAGNERGLNVDTNGEIGIGAIRSALPAGTNAIGKLSANSGVDIGDVDITTVIPGVTATSLGKAEDAAHSSGDTGVLDLAVSNENRTAFAAASGDYIPKAGNRYGEQYVTGVPPSIASSNGTPITATTTSVIAAPSAGNHLRIVGIHISNGGATAAWVAVRDGAAGTRHYNTYLPQGGVISKNINFIPLDLTTATRLDVFLSAAGSVEYEISYYVVLD